MKSDVIVKQFIDLIARETNKDLQEYLDGKNEWSLPIMEADIISINYNLSTIVHGNKAPTTGILLLHRIPSKK
jgi:hypothetical protein